MTEEELLEALGLEVTVEGKEVVEKYTQQVWEEGSEEGNRDGYVEARNEICKRFNELLDDL